MPLLIRKTNDKTADKIKLDTDNNIYNNIDNKIVNVNRGGGVKTNRLGTPLKGTCTGASFRFLKRGVNILTGLKKNHFCEIADYKTNVFTSKICQLNDEKYEINTKKAKKKKMVITVKTELGDNF